MQYRTHFVTSLAVALPIMTTTETLSIGSVIALSLGAVFPDIDEPHSWIGAKTRGISDILNKIFGHRGLTHSLLGMIIAFLTIMLMVSLAHFNVILGIYFMVGYALHLIEDSFSKSGVKWLLPFSDKQYQSGLGIYYYRTGSMIENLIFFGTVLILLIEIKSLDFSVVKIPKINSIGYLGEFINHISAFVRSFIK